MHARAEQLLHEMLGNGTAFRSGQLEAIEMLVDHRKHVLVVERTGWGKSLVYFIASKLLRERGLGPTLIISPLLSLMRNQVQAAEKIGVRASVFNSDNTEEWTEVESALEAGGVDVLLVSPERLADPRFISRTLPLMQPGIGLLVVDEAHCISDWGHDFRPDYRRIVRIVKQLPSNIPLLATTATANSRVIADIETQFGPNLYVQRGPLTRDSLRLQTITLRDQSERLAWLAQHLPHLPGTGIIYCLTIADCKRVSRWLSHYGIDAPAYYGPLGEERAQLEQRLLDNNVKALVATIALGMGFDKPDLGFVVHFQRPGSPVAYYQQVGRAGRAVDDAFAIVLNGREDDEIQDYFIRTAFPSAEATRDVLRVIEAASTITRSEILHQVNRSKSTVERILKLLEIDGAIAKEGTRYFRTPTPWQPNTLQEEQVTAMRRHELQRMQEFTRYEDCLMEFIARELDDPHARRCERCSGCAGDVAPRDVERKFVLQAAAFLRRDYQVIEPRKMWPLGGIGSYKGRIGAAHVSEVGRALCIYNDAVWGRIVSTGKYKENYFPEELVTASAELITQSWNPQPAPTWVTAIPSKTSPTLVPDFAARLAQVLGLPFHDALVKTKDTPGQKHMQNSQQQAQNALGAFVVQGTCPSGPVLLVDDIIHSGWTLAVCGVLLRAAGSGPVYPYALATAVGGGDLD